MARKPKQLVVTSRFPSALERKYRALLLRLVASLRSGINTYMVEAYKQASADQSSAVRADGWSDYIEAASQSIHMNAEDLLFAGRRAVVALAEEVATWAKKPWKNLAEAQIGVDIFKSDRWLGPMLESWAQENAKLISSIEEKYLQNVAQRAQDMVRQGRTTKQFAEELARQYDLTVARSKLIARTEMAKLNGQITKARQQSLGIREYEWSTSADERVRESHKVLNGKICRYDDPRVYRNEGESQWRQRSSLGGYIGDPGEDFQCRCVAAARVESLLSDILGETNAR